MMQGLCCSQHPIVESHNFSSFCSRESHTKYRKSVEGVHVAAGGNYHQLLLACVCVGYNIIQDYLCDV